LWWRDVEGRFGPSGDAQARGQKPRKKFIVEQQKPEDQNQIVKEGVVAGENDADLPGSDSLALVDAERAGPAT